MAGLIDNFLSFKVRTSWGLTTSWGEGLRSLPSLFRFTVLLFQSFIYLTGGARKKRRISLHIGWRLNVAGWQIGIQSVDQLNHGGGGDVFILDQEIHPVPDNKRERPTPAHTLGKDRLQTA